MSHLLKALERIIYKHTASFMESKFLPYLLGFRKKIKRRNTGFSKWPETQKTKLSNGEKAGVISMDLSKAFNTLNGSLLLEKIKVYVFLTKF